MCLSGFLGHCYWCPLRFVWFPIQAWLFTQLHLEGDPSEPGRGLGSTTHGTAGLLDGQASKSSGRLKRSKGLKKD